MRTPVAAIVLLCALPALAESASLRRGLPVDVTAPGWTRIAVYASPGEFGGAAYRVLDPQGRVVGADVREPRTGDVTVRAAAVDETADGWTLVFDLGPVPLTHDALTLDLARPTVAARCRVEASDDGAAWTPLATGGVFRIGESAGLRGATIDYPAARQRWLRVHWPRGAGLPELRGAAVRALAVPGRERVLAVDDRDGVPVLDPGAPDLPVASLAARAGTVGRVLAARAGRWTEVAAGAAGDRTSVAFAPPLRAGALRAEGLREGAAIAVAPRWVLFRATAPGRYTVTAGGAGESIEYAASDEPIRDVEPGAPVTVDAPAFTDDAKKPVSIERLPRRWSSWPVVAAGLAAGDVVRLELPPEVFEPGVEPGFVRPVAGDRSVLPFAVVTDDRPRRLATTVRSVEPGVYELDLPRAAHTLTQAELQVAGLRSPVRVTTEYRAVTRPGAPASFTPGASVESGPGPLLLDLRPPIAADALRITFADREARVTAAAFWHAVPALVFVWPTGAEVRVVSGFDPVREDAPQVIAVREQVLSRVAKPATVDLTRTAAETARTDRAVRWALIAAMVIVGAVLLFVLARSLRRAP